MIDFNKFTDNTQKLLMTAQEKMIEYKNSQIEPVHILSVPHIAPPVGTII